MTAFKVTDPADLSAYDVIVGMTSPGGQEFTMFTPVTVTAVGMGIVEGTRDPHILFGSRDGQPRNFAFRDGVKFIERTD